MKIYLKRLNKKKKSNRLTVEDVGSDKKENDNSIVTIHPDTMESLGLFRGDTVKLVGKKKKRYNLYLSFWWWLWKRKN